MPVLDFKIFFDFRKNIIGQDLALLVAPLLDYAESGGRVYINITPFNKIMTEDLKPAEIIIACLHGVVPLDVHVIKKKTDLTNIELVYVSYPGMRTPFLEYVQITKITRHSLLAKVIAFITFINKITIFIA